MYIHTSTKPTRKHGCRQKKKMCTAESTIFLRLLSPLCCIWPVAVSVSQRETVCPCWACTLRTGLQWSHTPSATPPRACRYGTGDRIQCDSDRFRKNATSCSSTSERVLGGVDRHSRHVTCIYMYSRLGDTCTLFTSTCTYMYIAYLQTDLLSSTSLHSLIMHVHVHVCHACLLHYLLYMYMYLLGDVETFPGEKVSVEQSDCI